MKPERPNLVARLTGRGEAPPLLLQGHVDVVTATAQTWTYPPFGGELVDDHVWGRGAIDMKGGVAMMVAAVLRFVTERRTPPGDVLIALVSDEEAGGFQGAGWLAANRPELFHGVRHALGEGGGFAWHVGGRRFYPLMIAEKRVCVTKAVIRGPGGHGSRPTRGGAMAKLGRALLALDEHRMPVHIGNAARWMVEWLRDGLPVGELRENVTQLLDPASTDSALGRMRDLGWRLHPLLHNSVNATMVRASEKFNVIPTEVELLLDCRLLPDETSDSWLRELGSVLDPEVELSILGEGKMMPGPELGTFFETLCDILLEADPGCVPVPSLMSGATDAMHFAQLGIRTYGFLPHNFPEGAGYESTMHAADERVPVGALEFGAAAIHQAVERYRA
ncbi:MAG TPA: M20/M25/M40 family metallo-hydrolase [Candidatus Dormibacteraeota bacterium]|nr:M20/M25/M40 family metallo-hydrolase [Candidatus Dormibacteraeota bacterium]